MSKALKVFTLRRSKWLRGGTQKFVRAKHSALYRPTVRAYCCLGLFALQCGVPMDALRDVGLPNDVPKEDRIGDFAKLVYRHRAGRIALDASIINDSSATTDDEKIAALRPVFRRLGYRIEVVP